MQARKTPTSVVAAATMALLSIQRPNGWSIHTEVKFDAEKAAGQGTTDRSRSRRLGSGGRSTIARLCLPENATVKTHRIG